jgi:ribosome recycling factor
MPIGQLANITLPDSQTIKIEPWDKSSLAPMEKAIYDADT